MWAFLQTYGSWIVFGLLLLLMFRMHASGQGCGGMAHYSAHGEETDPLAPPHEGAVVDADPLGGTATSHWPGAPAGETATAHDDTHPADRARVGHTSGCH